MASHRSSGAEPLACEYIYCKVSAISSPLSFVDVIDDSAGSVSSTLLLQIVSQLERIVVSAYQEICSSYEVG